MENSTIKIYARETNISNSSTYSENLKTDTEMLSEEFVEQNNGYNEVKKEIAENYFVGADENFATSPQPLGQTLKDLLANGRLHNVKLEETNSSENDAKTETLSNGCSAVSEHFEVFSESIRHFLAAVKAPVNHSSENTNNDRLQNYGVVEENSYKDELTSDDVRPIAKGVECDSNTNVHVNADSGKKVTDNFVADIATKSSRRTRARRNPVWHHFRVENGVAICTNCEYSTKSVYSTNLKVHLKSHHTSLYDQVRKAEEALEGNANIFAQNNASNSTFQGPSIPSPNSVEGKSDCESDTLEHRSFKSSRPPTRESVNEILDGMEIHTSAQNSLVSIPQLISDHFSSSQNNNINLLKTNLENALRNSHVNAANLLKANLSNASNLFLSEANGNLLSNLSAKGVGDNDFMPPVNGFRPLSTDFENHFEDDFPIDNSRTTKRKRLRRHPVWRFFKDVDDKTVGCVTCNFKTRSAFSTNLKMHLRAHHKEQYLTVMEMELEQCHFENNVSTATCSLNSSSGVTDMDASSEFSTGQPLRRLKRKRKSVEEIQGIIDKCKVNLAKERQRRASVDSGAPNFYNNSHFNGSNINNDNGTWNRLGGGAVANDRRKSFASNSDKTNSNNSILSAMAVLQAFQSNRNVTPKIVERNQLDNVTLQTENFGVYDSLSNDLAKKTSIEQLNTMICTILKSGNNNCDGNNNNSRDEGDKCQTQQFHERSIGSINGKEVADPSQLEEIQRLFEFCRTNNNSNDRLLRTVVLKQAIDLVLKRIVETLGSTKVLNVPAFRLLVSAILPDYDWSLVDSLQ